MRIRLASLAVAAIAVTALGGCAGGPRELMPTPLNYLQPGARAVFEEVPHLRRRTSVDLLYITDRAPDPTPEAGLPYGQSRARSVGYGSAEVRLLPSMGWEALARHSLSHPRDERIVMEMGPIRELGRYPLEPYSVSIQTDAGVRRSSYVTDKHDSAEAGLQAEVRRRLRSAPSGQVMLYVHGFNETFATAAFTAAELCHFFGRVHVCAFFTWPASTRGNPLISYTSTTESAQYSVGHLKKAIRALARTPGVEGIQLLAHSRGTALLLNAFRELAIEAVVAGEDPAEAFKLKNVVLMSPDIDTDVAVQQLEIFSSDPGLTSRWDKPRLPRYLDGRFTIYASPSDRALLLSKILFRSRERVGELTPDKVSPAAQAHLARFGNFDIVVYEGRRTDPFGHSYFSSNPEVSADLVELIRHGTAPGEPGRRLIREGRITWVFPTDGGAPGGGR